MDNEVLPALGFLDRYIVSVIAGFFVSVFLLWLFVNTLGLLTPLLTIIVWILGMGTAFFAYKTATFSAQKNLSRISLISYGVLFLALFCIVLYYFEPIIHTPYTSLGIPNKDLHDGISSYIAAAQKPPTPIDWQTTASFIPNSHHGLYLGYPNVLHTFAASFIQLGVFPFDATWIAAVFGIVVSSLSVFLLLKILFRDEYTAAIVAGFFAFSSFRMPYAMVTSIPMFFSFTLLLPAFLLFYYALCYSKKWYISLFPAVACALVAASYSGTIGLLFGLMLLYMVLLLLAKDTKKVKKSIVIIGICLPFLILAFVLEQRIYWQNTFPTAADFDPYEPSQLILALDKPLYMIAYGCSFVAFLYALLKKGASKERMLLQILFVLLNFFFLLPILYDLLFRFLGNITTPEDLVQVSRDGLFGGLMHQKISRLALFQPFVFLFVLAGGAAAVIKQPFVRAAFLAFLIFVIGISRVDIPLYNPLQFDMQLYNKQDAGPMVFPSDYRLIVPNGLWSQELLDALSYLKKENKKGNILLFDTREWSEESIAGFGSVYLQEKLYTRKEVGPTNTVDPKTLSQKFSFVLLIDPLLVVQPQFDVYGFKRVFAAGNNVFIYHIPKEGT